MNNPLVNTDNRLLFMQARLKTDVPLDNNNRPAMEVAGLECLAENPPYPQVQGFPGVKK
ncbi:hypothetical protein [Clostridium fessum]|uniref:hypothetical protein n=1 Tax=Clostridium fessum TaxID=2126740 RepID=UPI003AF03A3B